MLPADALRRIAYLLEAQGAETYKVQAFRRAASTVDEVAPAELARLDEQGRLETLSGVGKSTAAVISEALSGSTPGYLLALEEQTPGQPDGPVGESYSCSGEIVTATPTGPTGGAPSTRWPGRPGTSGTSTWY